VRKAKIHPEHLRKSKTKLKDFGGHVHQAGQKLDETGQNLVSHASGDRSGIGGVVANATGRASEILGKVLKEGGRVAGSAGDRLGKTADLYEEADTAAATNLRKAHPGVKRKVDPKGGGTRPGSSVGKGGADSTKKPKRVPGGSAQPAEKVGTGSSRKDRGAPSIPGGDGDSNLVKGDLRDPVSAAKQLPQLLKGHGVTQEEFDSMRHRMNQPGGTANVTHDEAMKWREIREAIPIGKNMPMQKVLSPDAAAHYMGAKKDDWFNPDKIRGCFARAVDVGGMKSPDDFREGLRLDYPGTPFVKGADSVYVFRTTATDLGQYHIPFGGPTEQGRVNIGGAVDMADPFTGNGFTGSDSHLVPEWERRESDVKAGDMIYKIGRDGSEEPVVRYHAGAGWLPVRKNDA
jgi:hypothetical protein